MSVLRNRPKGARFAFFGFGLCVFALIPNEIGYQDIASLLARQPGVAERWQKRVFSSALASVQVATFSFGRPINIGGARHDPLKSLPQNVIAGVAGCASHLPAVVERQSSRRQRRRSEV